MARNSGQSITASAACAARAAAFAAACTGAPREEAAHYGVRRVSHTTLRVHFHIIRNARIENVGKYQSCMVSKLRIIWKQTVPLLGLQVVAEPTSDN